MYSRASELAIDPELIAIGGESAGGNLTAVLSQLTAARARIDVGAPTPIFALMFMPVTDLSTKHRSYQLFSDGFFLTEAQMDWYRDHYLSDSTQALDPHASRPYLPTTSPDTRPALWPPPSSMCCATKAKPTRPGYATPAFRWRYDASPASCTDW